MDVPTGVQNKNARNYLGIGYLLLDNRLFVEWLVKIRRENTPVTNNSYIECNLLFTFVASILNLIALSSHLVDREFVSVKPRSVPTRFIFSVQSSARKKPCYRATGTPTTIKTNNNRSGTAAKSLLEVFDSILQNNEASPDVNSGETLNVF